VSEFAEHVDGHPYGDPAKIASADMHGWNGIVLGRNTEDV
jgi:hypothetical protein